MEKIGSIIQKGRLKKGFSAKETARQLGVAESTYRDWESGRSIQGEPYLKISQILDIPLGKLLGVENLNVIHLLLELEEIENRVKIIRQHVNPMI